MPSDPAEVTGSASEAGDLHEVSWLPFSPGPVAYEPYYITPSTSARQESTEGISVEETIPYAEPIGTEAHIDPRLLGDAIHAIYCRRARAGRIDEPSVRSLLDQHGLDAKLDAAALASRIEASMAQLARTHSPERVFAEVPLQLAHGDRLMNGTADLLMISAETIVLADHKVLDTQADPETLAAQAQHYAAQLSWYRRALSAAFPDSGVISYLNFPLQGRLVRVRLGGG
jgi:ATP-dependent exoDNAse (exonuclease V) beta subunit